MYEARQKEEILLQNGDMGEGIAFSNLALIKYWGKDEGVQNPSTSSISVHLPLFKTYTRIFVKGRFKPDPFTHFTHSTHFSDKNPLSLPLSVMTKETPCSLKLESFLDTFFRGWAPEIKVHVETFNGFPTACGIASSASGYAALVKALANLIQIEKWLEPHEVKDWMECWARLGSGSACRSISESPFVYWKKETFHQEMEDLIFHSKYQKLEHSIALVNTDAKELSSSDGHKNAPTSPFYEIRRRKNIQDCKELSEALAEGNFSLIRRITEEDALLMHGISLTGKLKHQYFSFKTQSVIERFLFLRNELSLNEALWTLDAGKNPHFLFMPSAKPLMERLRLEFPEMKWMTGFSHL